MAIIITDACTMEAERGGAYVEAGQFEEAAAGGPDASGRGDHEGGQGP
jgi:hypothetical protein